MDMDGDMDGMDGEYYGDEGMVRYNFAMNFKFEQLAHCC